jgi:hypothetical protein
MTVQVIDSFMLEDEARTIIEQFSSRLVGKRDAVAEADFSDDRLEVLHNIYRNQPITKENHSLEAATLITKYVNLIKDQIEKFYKVSVACANVNFTKLSEGGSNNLHCDSVQLDGSPWQDGQELLDDLEFSALLYLNNSQEDYVGGEIVFPGQKVEVIPKTGKLVFFKGDIHHPHKVEKVLSGNRYALVVFYGQADRVAHYLRFKAKEHEEVLKNGHPIS